MDYNKVDKALKTVGISLKDDVGQFRDLDDVFMELSKTWNTLSRNEQRYIATTAAGSRQQSRFIALMDNYQRTLELVEIAQNSEGRSSQQFAKYAESVEFKIKRLKNTWEQFRVSLLNSKAYKGIVDLLNNLLNKISKFNASEWISLIAVFTIVGRKAAQNFLSGWQNAINSGADLLKNNILNRAGTGPGSRLSNAGTFLFTGISSGERGALNDESRLANQSEESAKLYEEHLTKVKARSQAWFSAIGTSASVAFTTAFSSYMLTNNPGQILMNGLITGGAMAAPQIVNILSTELNNGVSLSKALGKSLMGGATSMLISVGINAAAAGLKALNNHFDAVGERLARANSAFYDAAKSLEFLRKEEEKLKTTLNENSADLEKSEKEYQQLIKSGDELMELDKKVLLTTEEKEKYKQISDDLVELYPTLLEYYDKEGTAILDLTDAYKKLTEEKKKSYLEDKSKVAQSEYELAINKYFQAIENDRNEYDRSKSPITTTLMQFKGTTPSRGFISEFGDMLGSDTGPEDLGEYLASYIGFFDNLTSAQKAETDILAEYFKEVLKDSSTFSDIQNKKGQEVLETIKSIILSDNHAQEELYYYIEQISYNTEKNTQEINNAAKEAQKALDNYIGVKLEGSTVYSNITDKNTQAAMRRTVMAANNLSFTALKEEFDNTVAKDKDWSGSVYASEFKKFYVDKLDAIMNKIDDQELSNIFSEKVINAWNQIALKLPENASFEQYARLVATTNFGSPQDTIQQQTLFYEEKKDDIDKINKYKQELAKALDENYYNLQIGSGELLTFEEGGFGEKIEQLGEKASDRFKNGFNNAIEYGAYDYLQEIKSLADFLTPDDFQTLMSQDWDKYSLLNAKQFWNSMLDAFTGSYSEDFKEKFGAVVEKIFTNTSASSNALFEQIDENFNNLETNISTYGKALKSALENGYIDATSLKALYKANAPLDKIINEDSSANIDELRKWIKEQLEDSDALVETIKKEEELELDRLQAIVDQWDAEQKITKELLYQQAILQGFSYNEAKNIADRYVAYGSLAIQQMQDDIDRKRSLIDEKARKYAEGLMRASWGSYYDIEKEGTEITKDNLKKVEDAKKAVSEAYDDILKKQQDLIDKQKELNDVLYGTSTHKSSLDLVYNYQTALDSLADRISQAKDILSDLNGKSPTDYINTVINATHGRVAYLTAQNDVYRNAITNTEGNLNTQLAAAMRSLGYNENPSKYIQYNKSLDRYLIDERLQSLPINDDLKKFIEEQGNLLNEYKENIFKNDEEIRKEQKEFRDYQKQVRDNYLSVEEAVVEKLKEYYQEEIDNKKEMYDALSEADNKYLEALEKAINKQKELRDRQNKWNDLAEKEKKYSLLSRDTSGANQKETLKLQKDIEKDRTSLLDESVSSVIDELKDLYELQKETRDTEIEYQQSLLENSNLVQEANAIMQSWKSIDDLMDWMYEHTEGIENMSDAAIEKLSDDWKTMFDNIEVYNELQQAEVSEMFNLTQNEIQAIINGTSELLTSESSRAIAEIKEQVPTAIKNATQAVTDAMKALTDAQTKYNEAIKTYNDLINNGGNGSGDGGKVKTVITDKDYAYSQFQADNGIGQQFHEAQRAQIERTQQAIENIILANEENLQKYGYVNYGPLDTISQQMLDTVYEKSPIAANIEGYLYSFKDLAAYNKMLYEGRLKPLVPERSSIEGLVNPSATHYASGGLVNYTGPAWVDGTPNKPEAFLSAEDTARIGEAANIFKEIASLGTNGTISSGLVSVGGNNIELHVHVDSIATEAQVDYLIDRMKEEIVDAARPTGSSVML